jgi:transcriptional regulator with XRE-family HTH domain
MRIGRNIKNLRKFKNINQEKLAEDLSIPRGTLCGYEAGTREPDLETTIKIADYFKVTLDDLVKSELLVSNEPVLRRNGQL